MITTKGLINIKDTFRNELKLTYLCEYQKKNCLKLSSCPLIMVYQMICAHHMLVENLKINIKFYEKYAIIYNKAKEEFKQKEDKPLVTITRYLNRFTPHLMRPYF
jgi:hypothetical protein